MPTVSLLALLAASLLQLWLSAARRHTGASAARLRAGVLVVQLALLAAVIAYGYLFTGSRLLAVAALVALAASVAVGTLAQVARARATGPALVVCALAVAVIGAEDVLGFVAERRSGATMGLADARKPVWEGPMLSDPVLGPIYVPGSRGRTYYFANPRGYFDVDAGRYFVEYAFNSEGCRGPEYAVPAAPHTTRLLALGDSFTVGVGVRREDLFTTRLEELLNQQPGTDPRPPAFEAINCGISGFSTREERSFYQSKAIRYRPDIVLVAMTFNDDRSWADDVRGGYFYQPGPVARLFYSWYLVQRIRHRRPPPDFSRSVAELLALNTAVQSDGARLVVVAFRHFRAPEWDRLLSTVGPSLAKASIPFLDLGETLLDGHTTEELSVADVDGHPNEIAHRLAADAIARWLP